MCVSVCVRESGSLELFEQRGAHRKGRKVTSFQTWCLGRRCVMAVCLCVGGGCSRGVEE